MIPKWIHYNKDSVFKFLKHVSMEMDSQLLIKGTSLK